jgi:hypothetical protein
MLGEEKIFSDKCLAFAKPQRLSECVAYFKILNLQVTLQLQGDCILPAYKGSMWHGWFGHGLKQVCETTFNRLYQQNDHEQPKAYAIDPGKDQKTEWRSGELIGFNLRLFGVASDFGSTVYKAFKVGEHLGLGIARTPVRLIALSAIGPNGEVGQYQACSLADYLPQTIHTKLALMMLLNTPLRLKQQGKVIHNQKLLTANLLAAQARRRLLHLFKYWVQDNPDALNAIGQQPLAFEQSELISSVYFEDWQRYSLKQQEFIPLGGLQGVIRIEDCSEDLYQWLKIGEQLQLGGKTTFGLGCYQVVHAL